jgi:S-DNA-T family DNA segregation ATPase FtsK/SpoIIIE
LISNDQSQAWAGSGLLNRLGFLINYYTMSKLFNRVKSDIFSLVIIASTIFVSASLISYNPKDPSINSIGNIMSSPKNLCGYVGSFLSDALLQLFGASAWISVCVFFWIGVIGLLKSKNENLGNKLGWTVVFTVLISTASSIYLPEQRILQDHILIGGVTGWAVAKILVLFLNKIGAQIFVWGVFSVCLLMIFEGSFSGLLASVFGKFKSIKFIKIQKPKSAKSIVNIPQVKPIERPLEKQPDFPLSEVKTVKPNIQEQFVEPINIEPNQRRKVTLKTKIQTKIENWELPKLGLIEDPPASRIKLDEREIRKKADLLTDKLSQFSVMGEVVAAKPGPAVTMFEFKPEANVRVSKITELEDDLALALSSESLRIIAPIPGRDVVGIETSNLQRETVYLKDLLAEEEFWKDEMKLPLALGKQANGDPKIVDLRKIPHLMVAGTTGSGKSVFTVSAITGLLFKHSPKTLKLILVDPKQVDLAAFEEVPHLAMPIVIDPKQAVIALKWAVKEMEKRYRSMSRFSARGLEAFNESVSKLTADELKQHEATNEEFENTPGKKGEQYYFNQLPYIVIVVEEFGDLMAVDKANVESAVVRLAQMARACGIHLILAMQSPRKEVVTGLIKTNIPGRISFKVNSGMDSRIILDETGGERLLAQGDMLYKSPGNSQLVRHHGPFLKDSDIKAVTEFWSDQAEPQFDLTAIKAMEQGSSGSDSLGFDGDSSEEEYDERYDEILQWAASQREISASLIQRRFSLGYPRAARLIETFEREGVVGPANGSKPRQVLVNDLSRLME